VRDSRADHARGLLEPHRKIRLAVSLAFVPRRGRPLKLVDADASCAARLGAALRGTRVARDFTLHDLASRIGYTAQHISEVELAHASASEAFVASCDRALDAHGSLLALYPSVRLEQVVERENRETSRRAAIPLSQEVDDVRRRAFIGLGLSVVLLGPEAAARATRDDWDRIGHAWSYELKTAPDRSALLPGIAADLKRLHANGGPQRVVAQLSSYVANIAMTNGDVPLARRWWRRARSAAVASGDSHLVSYVTGRQALQGLYGAYSPRHVVALADEALSATTAPCTGRATALGAKAQALAILGRKRATGDTLATLERTFEKLPRDITREKLSTLGWPEETLHHTRSYCGMFVGGGDAARDEALRLYIDADWRGPAQIRLHRATSEADAKDAVATLSGLSETQRADRFVRMIAARALASCEAHGVATGELREALA
jgi:transcriptional regulator with XRE-family HTH domain